MAKEVITKYFRSNVDINLEQIRTGQREKQKRFQQFQIEETNGYKISKKRISKDENEKRIGKDHRGTADLEDGHFRCRPQKLTESRYVSSLGIRQHFPAGLLSLLYYSDCSLIYQLFKCFSLFRRKEQSGETDQLFKRKLPGCWSTKNQFALVSAVL